MAFPALALFNLLREPIHVLPTSITTYISAFVSAKRLQEFLEARLMVCARFYAVWRFTGWRQQESSMLTVGFLGSTAVSGDRKPYNVPKFCLPW